MFCSARRKYIFFRCPRPSLFSDVCVGYQPGVAYHTMIWGGAPLKVVPSETIHCHDSTAYVNNHLLKNEGKNLQNRGCTTSCHVQATSEILGQSDRQRDMPVTHRHQTQLALYLLDQNHIQNQIKIELCV